jgi:hypothetical protein
MSRTIGEVLSELKALHSLQADAQAQLISVRRQQAEMVAHEASLLLAIDGRGRKIDKVLDEYGQAMAERGKALT